MSKQSEKKRSERKEKDEAEAVEEPQAERKAKIHPRRKGEYTPLERDDAKRYMLQRIYGNRGKGIGAGILARDDFDERDYEVLRQDGLVSKEDDLWCLTKAGTTLL